MDFSGLSTEELDARLLALGAVERALSRRRATLHKRLDFVRSGGFAHLDVAEQGDALGHAEHQLSRRRHQVHEEIDALRAERSHRVAASATTRALAARSDDR